MRVVLDKSAVVAWVLDEASDYADATIGSLDARRGSRTASCSAGPCRLC